MSLSPMFARLARSASGAKVLRPTLITRGLATVTDQSFPTAAPPNVPYAPSGKPVPAALKLKSGQIFHGTSFGAQVSTSGEAVFTTSVVGYPESMTDPSYRGQLLVFTQPLIGNYGVPGLFKDVFGLLKYFESDRIQCEGIVVNDYSAQYSHWTAVESLGEWCARHGVPAITGVDTRAIVHLLRDQGSTLARLDVGDEAKNEDLAGLHFNDPNVRNLVSEVSTQTPVSYNPYGDVRIAVLDCGVKHNILRSLLQRGAAVTVFPWNFDFTTVADQFDGLFISNGPGNPHQVPETINNLRKAIETYHRPIFGICMGNLLVGMAAGLDVFKLRFGNRAHNVPAFNLQTGKCAITSQNHGYALQDKAMPSGWMKYYVNANDGSNEGIRHVSRPIRSVQFHPEAKGGPRDTENLFEEFLEEVRTHKVKREGTKVFIPETIEVPRSEVAVV